jgi:hypothetical protein
MRHGRWLIVVALGLVSVSATVSTGGPPKKQKYEIDLVMFEGDPLGSQAEGTLKIVAEPHQVTLDKRESSFHSGGVEKIDGDEVRTGLTAKITPERSENGTIQLKVILKYTELLLSTEDHVLLQTNQARYFRTVKPGEVLRLRLSLPSERQQWVELTVKEFKPGK